MPSIRYDEVSFILDHAIIWQDGYERYWYRRAWEALEHQGATEYANQKEYYRKLLYAFALVHVYDEFCTCAFEEYGETDFQDYYYDIIPSVVLGQLVSDHLNAGEIIEDDNDALHIILDDLKYEVFRALKPELSEADVFLWMYCTAFTHNQACAPLDDEDDPDEPLINSIKDYRLMIERIKNDLLNDVTDDKAEAYHFISRLM